jgi:hypothetical protein
MQVNERRRGFTVEDRGEDGAEASELSLDADGAKERGNDENRLNTRVGLVAERIGFDEPAAGKRVSEAVSEALPPPFADSLIRPSDLSVISNRTESIDTSSLLPSRRLELAVSLIRKGRFAQTLKHLAQARRELRRRRQDG